MSKPKVKITFDPRVNELDAQRDYGSFYREDVAPGATAWIRHMGNPQSHIAHIRFACPCGCHDIVTLPVTRQKEGYGWKWDGNEELPTLEPSIQRTAGCRWHGHLVKGEFDFV